MPVSLPSELRPYTDVLMELGFPGQDGPGVYLIFFMDADKLLAEVRLPDLEHRPLFAFGEYSL